MFIFDNNNDVCYGMEICEYQEMSKILGLGIGFFFSVNRLTSYLFLVIHNRLFLRLSAGIFLTINYNFIMVNYKFGAVVTIILINRISSIHLHLQTQVYS